MKVYLKSICKSIFWVIYFHAAILIQLYTYHNFEGYISGIIALIFGITSGIICMFLFKVGDKKTFVSTALIFLVTNIITLALFCANAYFSAFVNLAVEYDSLYYEIRINTFMDIALCYLFVLIAFTVKAVMQSKIQKNTKALE